MKPFEFNNAIENLINLVEMKSFKKAETQLHFIEEQYRELHKENEKLWKWTKQEDEPLPNKELNEISDWLYDKTN